MTTTRISITARPEEAASSQRPSRRAHRTRALVTLTLLLGTASRLAATDGALSPLTLERAVQLARERNPEIVAARSRLIAADGQVAAARALFADNPVLDGEAGRRSDGSADSTDWEIGISQPIELAGQRSARLAAAGAGRLQALAQADDTIRRTLRAVRVAFFRALHARERLRVAAMAADIAGEVEHVAERRHRAGDVPMLDANLARIAAARARSDVRIAEGTQEDTQTTLRVLLALPAEAPLELHGDLRYRPAFDEAALVHGTAQRADLRALDAERQRAAADDRLARAERWPGVGIGVRGGRDEHADIVLGTLSLTLPVFDHGQAARAAAAARSTRASARLEAVRATASAEVRAALAVHARQVAAVDELEQHALPLLDENEALARRSYGAGEIGITELIFIRHNAVDTSVQHLDRLLDAAIAAVDVQTSAGVFE